VSCPKGLPLAAVFSFGSWRPRRRHLGLGSTPHSVSGQTLTTLCRSRNGFRPARARHAVLGFGRRSEKDRRSWLASAPGSAWYVPFGERPGRIVGGIPAVLAFASGSAVGTVSAGSAAAARHRPHWSGAPRTLERNQAHGRNGCRFAGNGGVAQRTRQWSKALKLAARVDSTCLSLDCFGGRVAALAVVCGFGCQTACIGASALARCLPRELGEGYVPLGQGVTARTTGASAPGQRWFCTFVASFGRRRDALR
jgi:hypothetical protein